MKFLAIATILSLSAFLSACATYPQSREDQATYHASEARSAISKGDSTNAANQIDVALTRPTGDAKIKELFASYPKGRDYYLAYLEKSIVEVSSAYQAAAAFE
ncbi:MAG TPA: hypothetical protein PLN11_09075, partial [Ottowia sp.]|nr:hypothetical protein [Ottowia sp.]